MCATNGKLILQVRGRGVDEIARIEQIIVDKSRQAIANACTVLAVFLNSFIGDMAALDARIVQALAGSAAAPRSSRLAARRPPQSDVR